jgi:DNA invertase Pin-like site-specific DNA recombinase
VTLDESAQTAKTAIYTQLASADDERIAKQERELLEYAEGNGYGQCVCYRDNGKSGVTLNRPELQNMLSDVESGVIATVSLAGERREGALPAIAAICRPTWP